MLANIFNLPRVYEAINDKNRIMVDRFCSAVCAWRCVETKRGIIVYIGGAAFDGNLRATSTHTVLRSTRGHTAGSTAAGKRAVLRPMLRPLRCDLPGKFEWNISAI